MAWVLGSLVLAAVISPWIYQGGKHLAATAAAGDLHPLLEWLGAACGRAKFGRFFDRSMLISAVLLLPVLYRRIKHLRAEPGIVLVDPRARFSWSSGLLQVVIGFVIAGGILWSTGAILASMGAFIPKENQPSLGKFIQKALLPAAGASLVEEWLFRGILLGLWLRSAKTGTACLGSAMLFAFLHFIKLPMGMVIADPGHPLAGFELLGKVLLHFSDPLFFATDFASLLLVGLILAWARVRTGALWFSIGLHAGWILAFKGFNLIYQEAPMHSLRPWGVGESLRAGLIPLATLAVTAAICRLVVAKIPALRSGKS